MSFLNLEIFPNEHYVSWLIRKSAFQASDSFKRFLCRENIISKGMKSYDVFDHSIFALRQTGRPLHSEINSHSILPFWQISLGAEAKLDADSLNETFNSFGLVDEKTILQVERNWKSCPRCRHNDVEKYGTSYWHVKHQIPGLLMCPQHRETLEKSAIPISNLHCGTLPHQVSRWKPVVSKVSQSLTHWNQFVIDMYGYSISNSREFANLKAKITSALGMDALSYEEKFFRCNELLPELEKCLGDELLAYLFKDYARPPKRGRFQILHLLYVYTHRPHMIRSPIYWVLLAYWLRHQIDLSIAG